jgi:hypothetical protein
MLFNVSRGFAQSVQPNSGVIPLSRSQPHFYSSSMSNSRSHLTLHRLAPESDAELLNFPKI